MTSPSQQRTIELLLLVIAVALVLWIALARP